MLSMIDKEQEMSRAVPVAGIYCFFLSVLLSGCAFKADWMDSHSTYDPANYSPERYVSESAHGRAEGNGISEIPEDATADDLVFHALRVSPRVEAAFENWQASREMAPQAGAWPDPRVSFSYYLEEVETRAGAQKWGAGLSQTVPWFGKLDFAEKAAYEKARAAEQEFQSVLLEVVRDVKVAYFEYYYVKRAIAIMKENVILMTELESVARARYTVGAAPYASVVRAQVELGVLQDRVESLIDLLASRAARLNALLDRPPSAFLPEPGPVAEEDIALAEDDLYPLLAATNPELKALDFAAAGEEAAIDLAKRGAYPDLTLGLNYIATERAIMPGTPDSGDDPVIASLSLTLPFLSPRYPAAEREAEHRLRAVQRRKGDLKNRLTADLKDALYRFRDGKRKINLYRNTLVPKAEQSLEVTRQAFEAGQASFLDLVDSERVLLEFLLSYERALADHAQSHAEVDKLLGGAVPDGGVQNSNPASEEFERRNR
jgi:outer membrane protein TolC